MIGYQDNDGTYWCPDCGDEICEKEKEKAEDEDCEIYEIEDQGSEHDLQIGCGTECDGCGWTWSRCGQEWNVPEFHHSQVIERAINNQFLSEPKVISKEALDAFFAEHDLDDEQYMSWESRVEMADFAGLGMTGTLHQRIKQASKKGLKKKVGIWWQTHLKKDPGTMPVTNVLPELDEAMSFNYGQLVIGLGPNGVQKWQKIWPLTNFGVQPWQLTPGAIPEDVKASQILKIREWEREYGKDRGGDR